MNPALTIFRRELGAYFNAPMAYVVAIATMLLNSSLYVLDLWVVGQVSMRSFFDWVSWTICLIVPAITMRSWAEDRKGGTYELLLTFPMRSLDLVLGKFLAALVFFAFCLSGSLVIPFVLAAVSTPGLGPEWGAIFAAYLGTMLAAALLVALGLFVSGLCRDQIEAFIVTTVLALALKLVGFGPVAAQVESALPWLGNFLRESVSYSVPLGRFARGVVDFGDILFFLTWTAAFLALNGLGLEGRSRRGAGRLHAATIALGLPVAALLAGLWLGFGLPRLDLTADKLYTISDAAVEVLDSVPEEKPVRIKLYFSPKDEMPTGMRTLERDVLDKLEAFQRRAGDALRVDVVHLHADDAILRAIQESRSEMLGGDEAGEDSGRGEVESQLVQEGVVPFRVRSGGLTGSETKVVYAALTLSQGASRKEVVPQVTPGTLPGLEKELVTRVYRLVNEKRPVVGLLAPVQRVDIDPQQMQLLSQLGIPLNQMPQEQDDYRWLGAILSENDQYELRRLRPGDESPLPEDLDTLVVVRPEGLSERMQWEISRFLHEGGNVVMAVQAFESGLRQTRMGAAMSLQPVQPGVDGVLEPAGLSVPQEMVLAEESFPMSYSFGPFTAPVTVDFRWIYELDAADFDSSTSLGNGVGGFMLVEASSPVRVDEAKVEELGLEVQAVLRAPEGSWTRPVPSFQPPADLNEPQAAEEGLALAVLARGPFPAPDAQPPAWPPAGPGAPPAEAGEPVELAPEPGSLLVLGTARPLIDDLIVDRQAGGIGWAGTLLKNAVDALSLGDALLRLSLREPRPRPIEDLSRNEILFWQLAIVGFAPAVYLALGLVRLLRRRRLQERSWKPSAPSAAAGGQS